MNRPRVKSSSALTVQCIRDYGGPPTAKIKSVVFTVSYMSASRLPTVLAEMVLDYARARPDRVAMFRNADPVWLRHSNLGLIRWDYGTGIMRFRHYRMVCRENNIILFV